MKEIFNLMREKIYGNNDKAKNFSKDTHVVNKAYADQIIAEAEAKWEEDCCEWTQKLGNTFVVAVSHENKVFTRTDMKFCPYCGKRIKIVEVE